MAARRGKASLGAAMVALAVWSCSQPAPKATGGEAADTPGQTAPDLPAAETTALADAGEQPDAAAEKVAEIAADAQPTDADTIPPTDAAPDVALPPPCTLAAPPTVTAPQLLTADPPAAILARANQPPFAAIWQGVQAKAKGNLAVPKVYADLYGFGNLVKAKALVGWLTADKALAAQALQALAALPPIGPLLTDTDAGIHVGDGLVGMAAGLHLAAAADPNSPQLDAARAGLGAFCSGFWQWVAEDAAIAYAFWPNNHSTKAASGLGMCALVLPGHPQAALWQGWAAATVRDIWHGYDYAPSGSCAEGPYYHMYAMSSVIPWLVASHRAQPAGACGQVLCATRAGWAANCQDHTEAIGDLLADPLLPAAVTWDAEFARPDGTCWPFGDAVPVGSFFGALAGPLQHPIAAHAFLQHQFTAWNSDLGAETLLFWSDALQPAPPKAMWHFNPDGGVAMWRSGYGADDRYVGLLAVPPKWQKAGHRQGDALHVEVFAFGAPRLLDAGYSKWADRDKVNKAANHNTVLVDGEGPLAPGLLPVVQDAELLQGDADGGSARALVHGQEVHRKLELLATGEIRVVDQLLPKDGKAHTLSVRWQGLGGLTDKEDSRGVFQALPDGASWQAGKATTWVKVVSAAAVNFSNDLQYDGLAYGVLKQHRSLLASVQGDGALTMTTRIFVLPNGEAPKW